MTFIDVNNLSIKEKEEYFDRYDEYEALIIFRLITFKGLSVEEANELLSNKVYSDFLEHSFQKNRSYHKTIYCIDVANHYESITSSDLETALAVVNVEPSDGYIHDCIKDGITPKQAAIGLSGHVGNELKEVSTQFGEQQEKALIIMGYYRE